MSTKRKPTLPDVQFVVMRIADLRPAAYNPRTISDDAMAGLEASITRFGLVQCPVFNRRSGTLIGGHQRVKVLEKQGVTETMTAVVDVDETGEKALNLSLNNPAIAGEFNERLADLLGIIQAEDEKLFGELRLDVLLPAEEPGTTPSGGDSEQAAVTLAERFLCPPFSVLDAKQGYWQARKKAWLQIGLSSWAGRDPVKLAACLSDVCNKNATKTSDGTPARATIFDPVLAEVLLSWFSPSNGRVLDPFAGGSVRGVVSSAIGCPYVGIDISQAQVEENRRQWSSIGPKLSDPADPTWIVGDSTKAEGYAQAGDGFDFILSCPPYFDLEVYSADPADLSNFEPAAFCRAYAEAVRLACERLKPERFAAFVVGEVRGEKAPGAYRGMIPLTISAFEAAGLCYYNEMILATPYANAQLRTARMFQSSRKICKVHQNVLVFYKGTDIKKCISDLGPVEVMDMDLGNEDVA